MIFTDYQGLPLNETMDGMDSAMRAGVMCTFEPVIGPTIPIGKYVEREPLAGPIGICRRHPTHFPSSNEKTFTRDQMICLVSGLRELGHYDETRSILRACIKRFFFAQNTERDLPGSKKYFWPHSFYKDSRPSNQTACWPKKLDSLEPEWFVEKRVADGPDPLLPHHMLHLAICANHWSKYLFGILGYPLLFLSIMTNSKAIDSEQNQLQCMVKSAGPYWVRLYKKFDPEWMKQTEYYWHRRNEWEYATAIKQGL